MLHTLKHPSGWIPLAMALAAFILVVSHVTLFGIVHEVDEGAAAHIWQILIAGQVPFVAYFAAKHIPVAPKPALMVLGLQIVALLMACAPVYFYKL